MTIGDFSKQIERLRDVYGPKTYSAERIVVLHAALKNTSEQDFEQAVTSLIADSRQAPMLNELKAAVEAARHARPMRMVVNNTAASNCRRCGGDGYLRIENERGYEILHRCNCEAGYRQAGELVFPDGQIRSIPMGRRDE